MTAQAVFALVPTLLPLFIAGAVPHVGAAIIRKV